MFVKLKNQKELIKKASIKAGSSRKLAKQINIPSSSIDRYISKGFIPRERAIKILEFIGINDFDKYIIKEVKDNFKQKLGGIKCVEEKKNKGTFERDMKRLQDMQSIKLKKWHKEMKENNPKVYYLKQYSRFKKIGGYKYKTLNGEKVRNIFEKQVADLLYNLKLEYKYEPLVNIGKKYFFPDFLLDNKIILECTMWRGETKAYKLKEKIDCLEPQYKVFVIIPKDLYSYYKILDSHLISGLDEFASVAQTFLADNQHGEKGSNR